MSRRTFATRLSKEPRVEQQQKDDRPEDHAARQDKGGRAPMAPLAAALRLDVASRIRVRHVTRHPFCSPASPLGPTQSGENRLLVTLAISKMYAR